MTLTPLPSIAPSAPLMLCASPVLHSPSCPPVACLSLAVSASPRGVHGLAAAATTLLKGPGVEEARRLAAADRPGEPFQPTAPLPLRALRHLAPVLVLGCPIAATSTGAPSSSATATAASQATRTSTLLTLVSLAAFIDTLRLLDCVSRHGSRGWPRWCSELYLVTLMRKLRGMVVLRWTDRRPSLAELRGRELITA